MREVCNETLLIITSYPPSYSAQKLYSLYTVYGFLAFEIKGFFRQPPYGFKILHITR